MRNNTMSFVIEARDIYYFISENDQAHLSPDELNDLDNKIINQNLFFK